MRFEGIQMVLIMAKSYENHISHKIFHIKLVQCYIKCLDDTYIFPKYMHFVVINYLLLSLLLLSDALFITLM